MPAPTPGYVKNMIRRSLREIVDPSPSKKEENKIWDFFNSECAYCGKKLDKAYKEGHIDHLVSSSQGGANHISNRVLSCATCNEKEKLDKPWGEFLAKKSPNKILASKRKEKIKQWQRISGIIICNKNILDKTEFLGNEVSAFYDEKIKIARKLRNKQIQQPIHGTSHARRR